MLFYISSYYYKYLYGFFKFILKNFWFINPLTSTGEGVTVFTSPYLSAGDPAQGEAKGLIIFFK